MDYDITKEYLKAFETKTYDEELVKHIEKRLDKLSELYDNIYIGLECGDGTTYDELNPVLNEMHELRRRFDTINSFK